LPLASRKVTLPFARSTSADSRVVVSVTRSSPSVRPNAFAAGSATTIRLSGASISRVGEVVTRTIRSP
jgi:hypothetical protein